MEAAQQGRRIGKNTVQSPMTAARPGRRLAQNRAALQEMAKSLCLLTAKRCYEGRAKLAATPGQAGDLWIAAGDHGLFHCPRADASGARFVAVASVPDAEAFGFGKAAPGQSYSAVYLVGTVGGVHGVFRSDDAGAHWTRINDDAHQYDWIGRAVTGDPRVYGRVYLATNGRGILAADP